MENKVNPRMLTIARESRGMSSAELAGQIGVTPAAAWYWEKEYFEVKDETLEKIASLLKYPITFFVQDGDSLPLPLSYRKRGKVPMKLLNQVDADINVYRLSLEKLLNGANVPLTKLPVLDPVELGSPQESAKKLRKSWKLPKGPIENLSDILEGKGIYLCSGIFASDRAYEKVKDKIDDAKEKVSQSVKIGFDDLESIYFRRNTGFSKAVRPGDQILMNWHNKDKTRRVVMPFATVLRVDKSGDEAIVIYDSRRAEEEISFSEFRRQCKHLDLEKDFQVIRTREISKSDFSQLKSIWH